MSNAAAAPTVSALELARAKKSGTRSLAALANNASTSRMLNLGLIAQRHGTDPEHANKPVFWNRALNNCILLKHRVRSDEKSLFKEAPPIATKLIFPFDWSDLSLGGRSVLAGERGFKEKLEAVIGQAGNVPQADWEMLKLFDQIPSLDPFLLREQLRRHKRDIAPCYFELSPADYERMQSHVSLQLSRLIEMAFSLRSSGAQDFVARIVEAILSVEVGERLEPLRLTLGLNHEEFKEGVFCWKGFLYYKWCAANFDNGIENLLRDFKRLRVTGIPHAQADLEFKTMKTQVRETVGEERELVRAAIQVYDDAFDDLTVNQKPAAFKKFLKESPHMFLALGDQLGIITHMCTFWSFRFPPGAAPMMDYAEALELFRDFAAGFAREDAKALVWD
jgi:hypothetical protein